MGGVVTQWLKVAPILIEDTTPMPITSCNYCSVDSDTSDLCGHQKLTHITQALATVRVIKI